MLQRGIILCRSLFDKFVYEKKAEGRSRATLGQHRECFPYFLEFLGDDHSIIDVKKDLKNSSSNGIIQEKGVWVKKAFMYLVTMTGLMVLAIAPLLLIYSGNFVTKVSTGASVYLGPGDVEKQETDSSCGPASLKYLMHLSGVDVTEAELAALAGTTQTGTSLLGLATAASYYGFEAEAWQLDRTKPDQLRTPAIVYLPDRKHFVVVTQVTAQQVVVADPAVGLVGFTPSEFSRAWGGVTLYAVPRG